MNPRVKLVIEKSAWSYVKPVEAKQKVLLLEYTCESVNRLVNLSFEESDVKAE